jgi:hypothetical protein
MLPASALPALPAGWFEARSAEGQTYYYRQDGATSWERPAAAAAAATPTAAARAGAEPANPASPGGGGASWQAACDPASGRTYFFDPSSGATRWELPPGASGKAAPASVTVPVGGALPAEAKGKGVVPVAAAGTEAAPVASGGCCWRWRAPVLPGPTSWSQRTRWAACGAASAAVLVLVIVLAVTLGRASSTSAEQAELAEGLGGSSAGTGEITQITRPLRVWSGDAVSSVQVTGDVAYDASFSLGAWPLSVTGKGRAMVSLNGTAVAREAGRRILAGSSPSVVLEQLRASWVSQAAEGDLSLVLALSNVTRGVIPDVRLEMRSASVVVVAQRGAARLGANLTALPEGVYLLVSGVRSISKALYQEVWAKLLSALSNAIGKALNLSQVAVSQLIGALSPSSTTMQLGVAATAEYTSVYLRAPLDDLVRSLPPLGLLPNFLQAPGDLGIACRIKSAVSPVLPSFSCRVDLIGAPTYITAALEQGLWVVRKAETWFSTAGDVLLVVAQDLLKGVEGCVAPFEPERCSLFHDKNVQATAQQIEKLGISIGSDIRNWADRGLNWCGVDVFKGTLECAEKCFGTLFQDCTCNKPKAC